MPTPKLERGQGKLVKHAPPRPYLHNESGRVIYVKSSTPYVSALKRIEKLIHSYEPKPNRKGRPVSKLPKGTKYIQVKGMGKAMQKVAALGVHFKFDAGLRVDILTKTIGVLDEFDGDAPALRKRNVSSIELKVYLP